MTVNCSTRRIISRGNVVKKIHSKLLNKKNKIDKQIFTKPEGGDKFPITPSPKTVHSLTWDFFCFFVVGSFSGVSVLGPAERFRRQK